MANEKWYLVNVDLAASTEIEGIRLAESGRMFKGYVVPAEYFAHTASDRMALMLSRGDFEAYAPSDSELEILYTVYPAAAPQTAKFKAVEDGIMSYVRAWYRVSEIVPFGLGALVDVQGICKRGDIAMSGDIVPAKFFAVLSIQQFERLEHYGTFSETYLERLASDVKARYKPQGYVSRYSPDKYELQGLYEKFPAMNPDYKAKIYPTAKPSNEESA